MRRILFICIFSTLPALANAACPAAPVGSTEDRVIQMVAGGDNATQMGSDANIDATEEGAIVYDATNNTIAVCDGTNWVTLGGGGDPLALTPRTSEPAACGAGNDGNVALAASYKLCVCRNGDGWVSAADGFSGCIWSGMSVAQVGDAYYGSAHSSYTFNNVNIGPASPDRIIVVFAAQGSFSSATPTSVTIGGVPATNAGASTGTSMGQGAWYAAVPTGTSADITVSWSGGMGGVSRSSVTVYSIIGANNSAPSQFVNGGGGGAGPRSVTLNIPADGVGISHCINADGGAMNWTNAIEDFEGTYASHRTTSAQNTTAGSQTMTSSVCRSILGVTWE